MTETKSEEKSTAVETWLLWLCCNWMGQMFAVSAPVHPFYKCCTSAQEDRNRQLQPCCWSINESGHDVHRHG